MTKQRISTGLRVRPTIGGPNSPSICGRIRRSYSAIFIRSCGTWTTRTTSSSRRAWSSGTSSTSSIRRRSFMNWACGVARYEVLNFLRARGRNRLYFSDELSLALIEAQEALEQEHLEERRDALAGCMKKLRQQDRELLEACYGRPAGIRDVARQSGRSTHSIHNSLRRIRRALFECVQRRLAHGRPFMSGQSGAARRFSRPGRRLLLRAHRRSRASAGSKRSCWRARRPAVISSSISITIPRSSSRSGPAARPRRCSTDSPRARYELSRSETSPGSSGCAPRGWMGSAVGVALAAIVLRTVWVSKPIRPDVPGPGAHCKLTDCQHRLAGQRPGLPLGRARAKARPRHAAGQDSPTANAGWPRSSSTGARGSSSRDRPASSSSRDRPRGSSTAR